MKEVQEHDPSWDFLKKSQPSVPEMKVALMEWNSRHWGFEIEDSYFPQDLLNVRKKSKGDPETATTPKQKPEIPSMFSFKDRADRLVPYLRVSSNIPSHMYFA